jgi:hypothetical protein
MEDLTPLDVDAEPCDVCGESLVPAMSPFAEGSFVDVAVEIEPFAVLACPHGHERRHPYAGWGNEVREGALDALPTALHEAFRGLLCRSCERPLDRGDVEPGPLRVDVPLSHGDPLHLVLQLPLLRCPDCGTAQAVLTDDIGADLVDAVDAALESAQVEP